MKKIIFVTGTRADYGKLKTLIKEVENSSKLEAFIFVSGMHLIEKYGSTWSEVTKDNYKNTYVDFSQASMGNMSYDLGNIICNLTGYCGHVKPDMIVVHGDRIDALAGAIVGALNNILVAHIEGGELSGTIDESTRHAISKFAHLHFVCNEDAQNRLIQLGEDRERIYIIGSPDIDIMMSNNLPTLNQAKERYEIEFDSYAIAMYHPVTTENYRIKDNIREFVNAMIKSRKNYILIYPNNDFGTDVILNEYERLSDNIHFRIFPSIRFEHFLVLLKNAEFMIGNSSAGVRETGVYGVPAIDIGNRQRGRYSKKFQNIQHVDENADDIVKAIDRVEKYRKKNNIYGLGDSTIRFMEVLNMPNIWNQELQKHFVDLNYENY